MSKATKVIEHGFFKGQIPPPPYFGVAETGKPTVAHSFGLDNDWKSACGVALRLMQSEAEAELITCPNCAEITSEWAVRSEL